MRLIKIAIANVNSTVGAVRANTDRVLRLARAAAAEDVTVACFPEQTVGGYPPEDLVQWRAYVASQRTELERFARDTAQMRTVFVVGLIVAVGGEIFNVAALVHRGSILGFIPKEKLPTYNVFYEARTLSHGTPGMTLDAGGVLLGDRIFSFEFGTLAAEVCEDGWSPDGPMRRRCYSGAELVVNLSASPYRVGVVATRREMLATRSSDNQATLLYANAVGAQDGLIFDGGGYVFQNGRMMLDAPRFREGLATCVVDLDRTIRLRRENTTWRVDCEAFRTRQAAVPVVRSFALTADRSRLSYPAPAAGATFFLPSAEPATRSAREEVLDDLFEALALGTQDYWEKTGAFRSFGIALSGGRDSLLTLLITWRAVQRMHPGADGEALREKARSMITAFYMPSRYSSDGTRNAAARICEDLGVPLVVVPIEEAFQREAEAVKTMLADGREASPVTLQNIQARLRGSRMWNWANTSGALFLQTGNMSEKSLGYTTVGGDLEGALSVIANVPKTVVIALLERLHARFGFAGIREVLGTMAGPELASNQSGEEELMPFPVLDACLHLYAGEKLSPEETARALPAIFPDLDAARLRTWAEKFASLFTRSIYKWVQSPLSLHVGSLELDRERALQLPVVERNEWGRGEGDGAGAPPAPTKP